MNERVEFHGVQNPVRAFLHGTSAALSLAGMIWLAAAATSVAGRVGMIVFGAGLTSLYLTSALYHSVPWSAPAKARMQRFDHSMIFLLIAATFTPFGLLAVNGWLRVGALVVVWSLVLVGIGLELGVFKGGRYRRVGMAIGLGWMTAVLGVTALRQVGVEAAVLLAGGGAMYSAGGLIYARRWPVLWPRIFSYHEVFHVLCVLASALHFAAVYLYILPLDRVRG